MPSAARPTARSRCQENMETPYAEERGGVIRVRLERVRRCAFADRTQRGVKVCARDVVRSPAAHRWPRATALNGLPRTNDMQRRGREHTNDVHPNDAHDHTHHGVDEKTDRRRGAPPQVFAEHMSVCDELLARLHGIEHQDLHAERERQYPCEADAKRAIGFMPTGERSLRA